MVEGKESLICIVLYHEQLIAKVHL